MYVEYFTKSFPAELAKICLFGMAYKNPTSVQTANQLRKSVI